jgi:predicted ATPase
MKKEFTVKNFKVFDEEGASFEIAPITILTGCNSSGKSSMTKSLLLLSKFIQKIKAEYKRTGECRPEDLTLGLPSSEIKLGNFTSVLNCNSRGITLSYSQYNYTVEYTFENEEPFSDDGRLSEILVKTKKEGEKVIHIRFVKEGLYYVVDKINVSILKDDFFRLCAHQLLGKINSVFHGVDEAEINNVINNPESTLQYGCDNCFSSKEIIDFLKQKEQIEKIIELQTAKNHFYEDIRKVQIAGIDDIERRTISIASIIDMLKYETLGCLPVFSLLEGVSKPETRTVLMNKIQKEKYDAENLEKWLSEILDEFESSEQETFLDYFRDKENNFLGEIKEDFPLDTKTLLHVFSERLNSTLFNRASIIDTAVVDNTTDKSCCFSFGSVFDTLNEFCINADIPQENVGHLSFENDIIPLFYRIFKKYLSEWLIAIVLPDELEEDNFLYVNSNRADIRRIYSDRPEDEFGKSLKRYLRAQKAIISRCSVLDIEPFLGFLNRWIEKFALGKGLNIQSTEEGAGMYAKIQKGFPFEKGRVLADEGYGITQLISVLVEIQTAIYNSKVAFLSGKKVSTTIIIEEPEIHLHPKFQSLLAEMFLDAYKNYGIHFIIETHSEYLIRRFQTLVAEHSVDKEKGLDRNELSIYYLYSPLDDDRPQEDPIVKEIGLRSDGTLQDKFGTGFVDESEKLVFDLLDISLFKRPQNDNTTNE